MKTGFTIQQTAKLLGIGSKKLFAKLRDRHILDRKNMPYQRYIDAGLFYVDHKQFKHPHPELGQRSYAQTMATQKGVDWLNSNLILKESA